MPTAESFRNLVTARAGGACEYCRLVEIATGATFHIEHILPQSAGGQTEFENLALSCSACNLAKGARTEGTTNSGVAVAIYNPRRYEPSSLGWHIHFSLDRGTGVISPRSPEAEATIRMLQINSPSRVFARQLQIRAGLIG